MLTTLTPSPLGDADRASLQPSLQPLLYALVMLTGECRQSAVMASTSSRNLHVPFVDLGYGLEQVSTAIAAHMNALGLPVDERVDGAADNNPFDSSFDGGETNATTLGTTVLSRCRQVASLVRTALTDATAAESLETALELQAVALAVSRLGGQLAQALR